MTARVDLPRRITSLSDARLRQELLSHRFDAGPILPSTRSVYERKLFSLQTGMRVEASSDYPAADSDDEESDDEPQQPPPRAYSRQRSPPMERREERREMAEAERLVRRPSPRRPLRPEIGDHSRYRPVGAARRAPAGAKSKNSSSAARRGRTGPSIHLWAIVGLAVVVIAVIVCLIRFMEPDAVNNVPDQLEMEQ